MRCDIHNKQCFVYYKDTLMSENMTDKKKWFNWKKLTCKSVRPSIKERKTRTLIHQGGEKLSSRTRVLEGGEEWPRVDVCQTCNSLRLNLVMAIHLWSTPTLAELTWCNLDLWRDKCVKNWFKCELVEVWCVLGSLEHCGSTYDSMLSLRTKSYTLWSQWTSGYRRGTFDDYMMI
jgi:hypothetical protein